MTAPRPAAAPGLTAALAALVPARLLRKLDQNPKLAESWSWAAQPDGSVAVTTDGNDRVVLKPSAGAVASPEQVSCTCLLAPRCLHLLAVVSALPIFEEEPADSAAVPAKEAKAAAAEPSGGAEEPTSEQRTAAREVERSLAGVLTSGALGAGAVVQGELLRALHACRAAGLARLSAALLRVVRGVRDCRGESPEFELAAFSADLAEALACARGLCEPGLPGAASWVGVARREYERVGSLRLWGLFTEPVLTASGYAGVATYLTDGRGGLFALADVAPGDAARVPGAYAGAARLGGGAAAHRELGRAGLSIQGATASRDGRLGAGKGVQAVKASGAPWSAPEVAPLFRVELSAQLDRAFQALEEPEGERRSDASLLFFKAAIAGSADGALLLDAFGGKSGRPVRLAAEAALTSPDLSYRENLRALAKCAGLRLGCIGRVAPERARRIELLAVANAGPTGLALPESWGGRCNLGLDRLEGAFLPSPQAAVGMDGVPDGTSPAAEAMDPLRAMRRWPERLALGGRSSVFPGALQVLERDSRQLEASLMPAGAALLRELGRAALDRSAGAAARLAAAFLAASEYRRVAQIALHRSEWG